MGCRRLRMVVVAVAMLVVSGLVGASPRASAQGGGRALDPRAWGSFPAPNVGWDTNALGDVSVLSPTEVWAVGYVGEYGFEKGAQIQRWNGTEWATVALPASLPAGETHLNGVKAIAPDDVWFVGNDESGRALTLHWDGATVTVIPNTLPSSLLDVDARSATDVWAVGYSYDGQIFNSLTAHWDGTSWTQVPSPNAPGSLSTQLVSVSARAANDVWAVGHSGYIGQTRLLAMHWDGAAWTLVSPPPGGDHPAFTSVSALSATEVWAAGYSWDGLIVGRWNGQRWQTRTFPLPNNAGGRLTAITAIASNDVWAVGWMNSGTAETTVALHFDGRRWTRVDSPNPNPSYNEFRAVDADAANNVWAVGTAASNLVARWQGAGWQTLAAPNLGEGDNILHSISALGANDIWAVGGATFGGALKQSLTLRYDGAAWNPVPSPNEQLGTELEGVAAIAADDVWAVGTSRSADGIDLHTTAMHWDGSVWTIVPTPDPGGRHIDQLHDVAAVGPNDVWAVGEYYHVPTNTYQALILHWDGAAWTQVPHGCGQVALWGIGVVAPDDIWAVGDATTCRYNGSAWAEVPSPQPSGSIIGYPLEAVDGAASNDVWAVGAYVVQSGQHVDRYSFAEHWDGAEWTPVFGLSGGTLFDVDAAGTDDVWAVGNSGFGALILHWDGTEWSDIPVPDPYQAGWFEGIEASVQPSLWAVGHRFEDGTQFTRVDNAPSATEGGLMGTAPFAVIQVTYIGPESGVTYTSDPFGTGQATFAVAGLPAGTYTLVTSYFNCTPMLYTVNVQAGGYVSQDVSVDCSQAPPDAGEGSE